MAYRRWRDLDELERPDLWVRRTCANLAVSQFRRRVVELRATARLAGRRQSPVELSEAGEEFWSAVRELPHRQAQTAALRFVYDMSMADIAETLGCTDGTVKQHLSRARHSLAATPRRHRPRPRRRGGAVMDLDTLARNASQELLGADRARRAARYADAQARPHPSYGRPSSSASPPRSASRSGPGSWRPGRRTSAPEPAPRPAEVVNGTLLAPAASPT